MANRAVLVSHQSLVVVTGLRRQLVDDTGMAFETELSYGSSLEHLRIGRTMRNVAYGAAF